MSFEGRSRVAGAGVAWCRPVTPQGTVASPAHERRGVVTSWALAQGSTRDRCGAREWRRTADDLVPAAPLPRTVPQPHTTRRVLPVPQRDFLATKPHGGPCWTTPRTTLLGTGAPSFGGEHSACCSTRCPTCRFECHGHRPADGHRPTDTGGGAGHTRRARDVPVWRRPGGSLRTSSWPRTRPRPSRPGPGHRRRAG